VNRNENKTMKAFLKKNREEKNVAGKKINCDSPMKFIPV
jgi:hypothetical protein